eukprot:gene18304-28203_t
MRFVEAVSDKLPSLSYKVYGVSRLWRVADIKQVARECGVEVKDYHLLGENNGANVLIQTQLPGVLQTAYEFQAAGVYINLDYTRPGTALVDSGASRMWWNTPEEDRRRVATAAACPASARTIAAALGTRDGRAVVDLCGDADEQTRQQIAAALAKLDTLLRRLNATKLEAKRTYTRKDAVPTGKPKKVVRVQLVGPDGWLLNEAQAHIIKNAVMCRIEEKYGALTDIQGGRWLYIAQTRSNEVLLDLGKSNAWLVADACRSVVGNPLLDAYPIVLDADLTVAAHTLQPASKTCIYKPSGSRLVRPDKGWAAPLQTSLPRRALAVRLAACGESRCSIDSQGKKVDRGLTAGLDVATLDSRSASGHTTSDDGIPDRPSPASPQHIRSSVLQEVLLWLQT